MTEDIENLIKLFNDQVELTPSERELLKTHWSKRKSLKRNDFLISKGEVEKYLYYISEGTVRIYFPNFEEEICVGFGSPNTLICSFPSFIKGLPSDYYIQAIKKCCVLKISKDQFDYICNQSPAINKCWQIFIQEALLGKIERETEMLTFTPKQRLERILKRSPKLFQNIPKKYIASYLRMSPETLSRIYK